MSVVKNPSADTSQEARPIEISHLDVANLQLGVALLRVSELAAELKVTFQVVNETVTHKLRVDHECANLKKENAELSTRVRELEALIVAANAKEYLRTVSAKKSKSSEKPIRARRTLSFTGDIRDQSSSCQWCRQDFCHCKEYLSRKLRRARAADNFVVGKEQPSHLSVDTSQVKASTVKEELPEGAVLRTGAEADRVMNACAQASIFERLTEIYRRGATSLTHS